MFYEDIQHTIYVVVSGPYRVTHLIPFYLRPDGLDDQVVHQPWIIFSSVKCSRSGEKLKIEYGEAGEVFITLHWMGKWPCNMYKDNTVNR